MKNTAWSICNPIGPVSSDRPALPRQGMTNRIVALIALATSLTMAGCAATSPSGSPSVSPSVADSAAVRVHLAACTYDGESNMLQVQLSFTVIDDKVLGQFRGMNSKAQFSGFTRVTIPKGPEEVDAFGIFEYDLGAKDPMITLQTTAPDGVPPHLTIEHLQFSVAEEVTLRAPSWGDLESALFEFPFGNGEVLGAGLSVDNTLELDLLLRPDRISGAFLSLGATKSSVNLAGEAVPHSGSSLTPDSSGLRQILSFDVDQEMEAGTIAVSLSEWGLWTVQDTVVSDLEQRCVSA